MRRSAPLGRRRRPIGADLARALDWLLALYEGVGDGSLPADSPVLIKKLGGLQPAGLAEAARRVEGDVLGYPAAIADVCERLELEAVACGTGGGGVPRSLRRRAQTWRDALPRLQEMASFNMAANECDEEGLANVSDGGPEVAGRRRRSHRRLPPELLRIAAGPCLHGAHPSRQLRCRGLRTTDRGLPRPRRDGPAPEPSSRLARRTGSSCRDRTAAGSCRHCATSSASRSATCRCASS